jgi:transposase-like protein
MKVTLPLTPQKMTRRGRVVVSLRQQYNLAQKMALIDLSRCDGIRKISKKFGIHRSMLQRWIKQEGAIRSFKIIDILFTISF